MNYEYHSWIPEFSLRNSALSSLASEAAIDINNYLRIKTQEEKSIQYLAHLVHSLGDPIDALIGSIHFQSVGHAGHLGGFVNE